MSSGHGILCRDLIGGSLQIKSQRVLDKNANLCVNDAKMKGDLTVKGITCLKGDLTVTGCITNVKLCPERTRAEPTDILELGPFTTSGNILSLIPTAPIISANVAYLAKGDPADPIALCVHGVVGSADEMRFLMDDLSQNGYYAVAPYIRGAYPTEIVGNATPVIGTVTTYNAIDLVELFAIQLGGLVNPLNFGKHVYIGSDFGAVLGPATIIGVKDLTAGAPGGPFDVFGKYVSLSNIPQTPILSEFWIDTPNLTQMKASSFTYAFNISPQTGFLKDLAAHLYQEMFARDIIQENPNAVEKDVDNSISAALGGTDPDQDREWMLGNPREAWNLPLPFIPLPIPGLYVISENDPFLRILQRYTRGELTTLIKDPANAPAGAQVYFSDCAWHWPHLDDIEAVNERILTFLS